MPRVNQCSRLDSRKYVVQSVINSARRDNCKKLVANCFPTCMAVLLIMLVTCYYKPMFVMPLHYMRSEALCSSFASTKQHAIISLLFSMIIS